MMTETADIKATIGADYQFTKLGRDRFPIAVKRILFPTDLTRESVRAIEFGLVLAEHFSAHLTLLHVYHESYAVEYMRGPHASGEVRKERIHSVNALNLFAKNVKERYADCDAEFRDGDPCEEIVSTAKEQHIDLIVISTHHYTWLTRLAYGCDAARILRRAPCPILIVKITEEGVPISQESLAANYR